MKIYTKQERKEIHAQLVAAVPYLKKQEFICHAIAYAELEHLYNYDNLIACKMIAERIAPNKTIISWLKYEKNIYSDIHNPDEIQTYRKEWLEHLIKEFSQ